VADEEAVWKIVEQGTIRSTGELFFDILKVIPDPLHGGAAAVRAILDALDFFVKNQLTPHTSYQFIQPVAGDPRDCWAMGRDYIASLVGQTLFAPVPVAARATTLIPQPKDVIAT